MKNNKLNSLSTQEMLKRYLTLFKKLIHLTKKSKRKLIIKMKMDRVQLKNLLSKVLKLNLILQRDTKDTTLDKGNKRKLRKQTTDTTMQ